MRNFIKCFHRDSTGHWTCIQPCEIDLPRGRIQVAVGTVFAKGTPYMDVDVAELLEEQYAEHQRH